MGSFTGSSPKQTYKDILQIDNSNQGVDTSNRVVKDGAGNSSAMQISDDKFTVQPANDDGRCFGVNNKAGVGLIFIDSDAASIEGSLIKDEDDMDSDSEYHLATQQSIKAYADAPQYILHFMNAGWYAMDANLDYMPLNGYVTEQGSTTNMNEYIAFVVPYDGELERVIVRSESACGSSKVGFHKSSTGTEVPNATATEAITVNMADDDTAYAFDFTATASFSAGDIIAISFDPTAVPYDTNATIIFKFDTTQGV